MISNEIIEGLRNSELFALLSEAELKTLAASLDSGCEIINYKAGEPVFEQGGHSAKLLIIIEGQVLLQRVVNTGGKAATLPLGLLSKGRAMGWSSLLHGPRYVTATAVCQKPTKIISIDSNSLRAELEKQVDIGFKVMDRLACLLGDRLRMAYNTMDAHL